MGLAGIPTKVYTLSSNCSRCLFKKGVTENHNPSAFPKGLDCVGIELSSRSVARQVFSPLQSLTSVFGMGTGGPFALETPTVHISVHFVSAMSYLSGPSPDKYCRHCRA